VSSINITTTIQLSEDEQKELSRIIGCETSELPTYLVPYSSAALHEMISMFLGQNVFTRGSDLLENRLFLLIKYALGCRIPDEQTVCKLFQNTATQSRSLIRAVMSKYQYFLKDAIDDTLKELLEHAEVPDEPGPVTIAIHNWNLVDELNRELAEIDSSLPPVQKKRGSVSTCEIKPSSYNKLCSKYNIESKLRSDDE